MDNPLENDVKRRPKEEVCDPEPREAQAVQGCLTKQENSIHRMHSYQQEVEIVVLDCEEWENDEPEHTVCQHHCTRICLIDDLEQVTPESSNLPSAIVFVKARFSSRGMGNVSGAKFHVCPRSGDILIGELAAAVDGQGCAKPEVNRHQNEGPLRVVVEDVAAIGDDNDDEQAEEDEEGDEPVREQPRRMDVPEAASSAGPWCPPSPWARTTAPTMSRLRRLW